MARALNGSVEIEFDTFGDPSDRALMLIMGYTAQMTAWDAEFCQMLAGRDRFVIRFDNRDCGLSSKTEGDPPNVMALLMKALTGAPITEDVPYSLSDMAADGIAVLDQLGVARADVVGASMGGMIAQQMAIEHPDRVNSLTSIMSTTGALAVGQPKPDAQAALFTPPPPGRDAIIDWTIHVGRTISGPLFDEAAARDRATAAYDRSFNPVGGAFQMAAIAKTGDRTASLKTLDVPTLVIHGTVDPLIQLSGGEATAAAIRGARLLTFDTMGHDLPRPLWPSIADAIDELTSARV
jgi:pimeloyl-ACP methyl ester carboxylesterase